MDLAVFLAIALASGAIWVAGAAPSSPAGGKATGQILGRVVDRTAPAHALAGQVVRLAIVERGASSERRAVSDAQGRFAFTGLPVGGIRVFLLSTEYGGVRYESGRIVLTPSEPTRSVALVAYDPASDRSAVRVALVFGVVDIARGGIRVSVLQRLQNATDRTAVGTARDPLMFPLPRAAAGVTFLGGWRDPHVVDGRIEDAIPVLPGRLQVAYAYGLDARGRALTVPWSFPDGAADVEILVADAGVRIVADGLHLAGTVAEAGRRYQRWSGGPMPRGGQAAVRLDGIPAAQDAWTEGVAAALAVVLGSGLLLALRYPRGPHQNPAASGRRAR